MQPGNLICEDEKRKRNTIVFVTHFIILAYKKELVLYIGKVR